METARSGFWTLNPYSPGEDPITFCERHALEATNQAFTLVGQPEAQTMSEAANFCAMVSAINGKDFELLTYSDIGVCEECTIRAEIEETA